MAKITIFGLAGAGTSTVGKMLAEKLGYKFLSSGDIFRKKARDSGITLPELHECIKADPEAAEEHILTREKRDAARYKNFYGIANTESDGHFDFVIDTTNILPEQVVEKIEKYLQNAQR